VPTHHKGVLRAAPTSGCGVSGGPLPRPLPRKCHNDKFPDSSYALVRNTSTTSTWSTSWSENIQRRYPSQRATPFIDARIDFDLRTAIPFGGPPKTQPRWLSAAYGSFVNKETSNYQIQTRRRVSLWALPRASATGCDWSDRVGMARLQATRRFGAV